MANFYMTVGIPGCGKSQYAKQKFDEAIHISSDALRQELYGDESCQDNPALIFQQMKERAIAHLIAGNDVYYDATNINAKKRIQTLNEIKRAVDDVLCYAVYFMTSLGTCIERDLSRPRTVGVDVIMRMYKSLQVPQEREGFDGILFADSADEFDEESISLGISAASHEKFIDSLSFFPEAAASINFEQHNPHHSLTVSEHMYKAYVYAVDNNMDWRVQVAAALHDIGKPICQEFNGEYARYFGHEYVSAQLAVRLLWKTKLGTTDILYIADLIQNHMKAHQIADASEKAQNRMKASLGETKFKDLMLLHQADMSTK